MSAKPKFPDVLLVQSRPDLTAVGKSPFCGFDDISQFADGEYVAEYRLAAVKRVVVTITRKLAHDAKGGK